jgi:hypothetical protein
MADPIQELLGGDVVPAMSFPPTSRYVGIPVELFDPGGGEPRVPYLRRRLCPSPDRFATLYEVRVVDGDRRDLLAARHLGDVELWWRLADANGVVDPRSLAAPPGRTVRITLPENVPGDADG